MVTHETHTPWLAAGVCQACGAWEEQPLAEECPGDVRTTCPGT